MPGPAGSLCPYGWGSRTSLRREVDRDDEPVTGREPNAVGQLADRFPLVAVADVDRGATNLVHHSPWCVGRKAERHAKDARAERRGKEGAEAAVVDVVLILADASDVGCLPRSLALLRTEVVRHRTGEVVAALLAAGDG